MLVSVLSFEPQCTGVLLEFWSPTPYHCIREGNGGCGGSVEGHGAAPHACDLWAVFLPREDCTRLSASAVSFLAWGSSGGRNEWIRITTVNGLLTTLKNPGMVIYLVKLIESDANGWGSWAHTLSVSRSHLLCAGLPKTCCHSSREHSSGQNIWTGLRSFPGIWTSW